MDTFKMNCFFQEHVHKDNGAILRDWNHTKEEMDLIIHIYVQQQEHIHMYVRIHMRICTLAQE